MTDHGPNLNCVLKVGEGRGFIIEHRVKSPSRGCLKQGLLSIVESRLVVTAAHCLPKLPEPCTALYSEERTYKNLLGSFDGGKIGVFAECLFVDPVADIAVLGRPGDFDDEANDYDALVDDAPFLRIRNARSGQGWVLSLEGRWIRTVLKLLGVGRFSLEIDPTEPGMSGSPILNDAGRAIGVVSIGSEQCNLDGSERRNVRSGPQPILTQNLPRWVLQFQR